MTEPWLPEKRSINFDDEHGVGIILSYNWHPDNKSSSMFIYWGNEKYKEMMMNFSSERHGREKIEKYWKKILELDENKKLTLDTLCDTIENTFIPKKELRTLKEKYKKQDNSL